MPIFILFFLIFLPTIKLRNHTRDRFKEETKFIAILYCEGVQFGASSVQVLVIGTQLTPFLLKLAQDLDH